MTTPSSGHVRPLSARAHALLALRILGAGDFRNSVEEFRTSLALNENEALAICGLAMVDFYENHLQTALAGLRRAVTLDPDEPDYVFNLGQAAARTERYKEAADAYERFLLIAPKTDVDRRERIAGLIDFLRYLGRQGSLYVPAGAARTVVSFEAVDNRPILTVRINGEKDRLKFVLDTGTDASQPRICESGSCAVIWAEPHRGFPPTTASLGREYGCFATYQTGLSRALGTVRRAG